LSYIFWLGVVSSLLFMDATESFLVGESILFRLLIDSRNYDEPLETWLWRFLSGLLPERRNLSSFFFLFLCWRELSEFIDCCLSKEFYVTNAIAFLLFSFDEVGASITMDPIFISFNDSRESKLIIYT